MLLAICIYHDISGRYYPLLLYLCIVYELKYLPSTSLKATKETWKFAKCDHSQDKANVKNDNAVIAYSKLLF